MKKHWLPGAALPSLEGTRFGEDGEGVQFGCEFIPQRWEIEKCANAWFACLVGHGLRAL